MNTDIKNLLVKINHLPVVSFVRRYLWLVIVLWIAYLAARNDTVFRVLDIFAYLPIAFAAWVILPLLWRNVFNQKTTDAYVDSKQVQRDFEELSGREKCWFTMIQMGFYLLGSAVIVSALISNLFSGS